MLIPIKITRLVNIFDWLVGKVKKYTRISIVSIISRFNVTKLWRSSKSVNWNLHISVPLRIRWLGKKSRLEKYRTFAFFVYFSKWEFFRLLQKPIEHAFMCNKTPEGIFVIELYVVWTITSQVIPVYKRLIAVWRFHLQFCQVLHLLCPASNRRYCLANRLVQ